MIDVVQEKVQRLDALLHAGLDLGPGVGRQNARDDIERQDAVDGVLFGIDRERDAEVEQLPLGVGGPLAEALPDRWFPAHARAAPPGGLAACRRRATRNRNRRGSSRREPRLRSNASARR